MHIALLIGGNVLMGTDITDPIAPSTFSKGISLSVDVASEKEAHHF